eukprot:1002328-Pyramimonas_sp.AAC.1
MPENEVLYVVLSIASLSVSKGSAGHLGPVSRAVRQWSGQLNTSASERVTNVPSTWSTLPPTAPEMGGES